MTTIDPTTPLGKVRLRIGDWSDIPILPDSVINASLTDCQNSIPRTSQLCAQYILATLTAKTHKKLAQLEAWSGEQFNNYLAFLKLIVLNPHVSATAPVPYVNDLTEHPIQEFMDEWKAGYLPGAVVVHNDVYQRPVAPVIIDELS